MKNILFPTDFSNNSWNALTYLLKLYAQEECTIYILNSTNIKGTITANLSSKLERIIREKSREELLKMIKQATASNGNSSHHFETISSSDYLIDAVKNTVKKCNIEMVIMGTKGATGAKELFFGSNTVTVIEKMRLCPILIIPEKYEYIAPKQIAFATAFNRLYIESELKPLIDMAHTFNSNIRIVHIQINKKLSSAQQYHKLKLEDFLQYFEYSFHLPPVSQTIPVKYV